jgi:thymidylate synthase ThyX
MSLDEAGRALVSPFVSSLTDGVFALAGLPEEAVAVLFAYDAQSADDLRGNLARLLADGSLDVTPGASPARALGAAAPPSARAFHEAWAGPAHPATGAHAAVHLALEGPSILAARVIEDQRLGSYTEKALAHLALDRKSYVDPEGLAGEPLTRYRELAERLLGAYLDLLPRAEAALRARGAAASSRAQAADLVRGLLPAGARTRIGFTANGRAVEALASKMLSHPLGEVRSLGERLRRAALHVAPSLVQPAAPSAYRAGRAHAVAEALRRVYTPPSDGASATMVISQPVRLIRHDKDALERVALALTYDGTDPRAHAQGLMDGLRQAMPSELEGIVKAAFAGRGAHDEPPRGLEASSMTFELMLDYAAYRDLQRHRMLSPATQRLTCRLGFETPVELTDLGLADAYQDAMFAAHDAWEPIDQAAPQEAQYAVPLGYRIRTLWTLSLRELFHVIELRSAKGAHPSCRRIAQGLYRAASGVHPWMRELARVDLDPGSTGR